MKRIVLEWGLILSATTAAGISAFWVHSQFLSTSCHCLELRTVRSARGGDALYLVLKQGEITFSNGVFIDSTGNAVTPYSWAWSVSASLLYPAALMSVLAFVLHRRFHQLRTAVPRTVSS